MKTKTLFRLIYWLAGFSMLVLIWAGRIVIELLALCAPCNAPTVHRDMRDRRYSWDYDGYSWEGRRDEMK